MAYLLSIIPRITAMVICIFFFQLDLATAQSPLAVDQLGITGNLGGALPTVTGQVQFGWNYSDGAAGQAEADMFNTFTTFSPVNSFCWYQYTTASSASKLMCLKPSGSLTVGATSWIDLVPGLAGVENTGVIVGGSQAGQYGVLGLSSSLNGGGAYGVGGIAINDRTASQVGSWAGYFEGRRLAGAGNVQNIESNVINLGSVVDADPATLPPGATMALWLTSGRHDVSGSAPASMAIGIFNNGAVFQKGIIAYQGSVATDVTFGRPIFIDMPWQYGMTWHNATDGAIVSSIQSDTIGTDGPGGPVDPNGGFRLIGTNSGYSLLNNGYAGITAAGSNVSVLGNLTAVNGTTLQALVTFQAGMTATSLPSFSDESAAAAGGLPIGGIFLDATGALHLRRS